MRNGARLGVVVILCVGGPACGSASQGGTPTPDTVVGVWQRTDPALVGDGDDDREYFGSDGTSIAYVRPSASKGGLSACFTSRYSLEGDEIVVENTPQALRQKYALANGALLLGTPPNQRRYRRVDAGAAEVSCKTIGVAGI